MIAFSIGNIHIYWYGIFYLISFIIAYFFLKWIGKKKFFLKYPKVQYVFNEGLEDFLIALILGVLIGGRLGEVFIYSWDYFSQNLSQIFAVRNGGMSFVGGFIGVLIAVIVFSKVKKISLNDFFLVSSTLICVVPIAIMLGRFGNYLNQELYGLVVSENFGGLSANLVSFLSSINIFHVYPNVDQNLRVNTNFLSIIFEGLLIFVVIVSIFVRSIKKREIKPYLLLGIFFVMYSFARFMIEYLRIDSQSQYLLCFTKSQRIFIALFLVGVFMLIFSNRKKLALS